MNGTQEDEKINFFGGEGANLWWGKCCHILRTDLVYLPPSVFYLWQPSGKPLAAVLKDDGADFLYFREIKEE